MTAQPASDAPSEAGRVPVTQFSVDDYEAHVQTAAPIYEEAGRFIVRTLRPSEYGAAPESWAAAQDGRGLLYVANVGGVLVHDGVTWHTLPLPNQGAVYALTTDVKGRVIVGGYNEFGYLIDGGRRIAYHSLVDHVPADARSFANIRDIVAMPSGAYFVASNRLFRWTEGQGIASWSSEASLGRAARLGTAVFVHRAGRGLATVRGDSLRHVAGTEALADATVYVMTPLDEGRLLVGTRTAGLFVFDGRRLSSFPTSVDDRLAALQLSNATVLSDGSIALATLRGGVLWLNADGRLLRVFDERSGLPSDDVKALYYDDQDGLWTMTANGLARIVLPAPLTHFTEEDGFRGSIFQVVRHKGRLYVSTSAGVYVMRPPAVPGSRPRFAPIRGIAEACLALHAAGPDLLAGCDRGVYRIEDDRAVHAVHIGSTLALHRSRVDTNRVYAGLNRGLAVLRRTRGQWHLVRTVDDVRAQVRMIVEDDHRNVWIGTNHGSTYRMRLDASDDVTRVDYFDRWANQRVHVFEVAGAPLFSIRYGLFRYDPTAAPAAPFVPDTILGAALTGRYQNIFRLSERTNGDLLLRAGSETGFAYRRADGSYDWTNVPLRRSPKEYVYGFLAEDDGVSWIGGAEGLFRHDARVDASYAHDISVLIREVTLANRDSTLYRGAGAAVALPAPLAHASNSIRFTFAAPRFEAAEAVRYRVRLRGFDADWSAWTTETRKDYTNLSHGEYVFEVQARDVYGHVSRAATVPVKILPPWYRTTWAYLLWGLLTAALVAGVGYGAVRRRTRQLEARSRRLEAEVAARTEEVRRQNAQLEAQAERLAALDAAKSRFFANVSHEFRTPLTLTLGPVEDILAGEHGPVPAPVEEKLQLVHRNASRLLRLINQLLDLARLEAGHVQLEAVETDLVAFLDGLVVAFSPLAERRRVALSFAPDVDTLHVHADRDKLEKIVVNLLSNAFKATGEGGAIRVRLRRAGDHAEIAVEDTGVGIPAEALPTLFDRFNRGVEQGDDSAGTGIGLNLTKEFVELHGGTIEVASTPGAGTTFTVRLPLGRAHLRDDQIADAPAAEAVRAKAPGATRSRRPTRPPRTTRRPTTARPCSSWTTTRTSARTCATGSPGATTWPRRPTAPTASRARRRCSPTASSPT